MKQKVIDFHQDEKDQWVADLECGHGQHMIHRPPFYNRPWVITPEGRARFLGTFLECQKCEDEKLKK